MLHQALRPPQPGTHVRLKGVESPRSMVVMKTAGRAVYCAWRIGLSQHGDWFCATGLVVG